MKVKVEQGTIMPNYIGTMKTRCPSCLNKVWPILNTPDPEQPNDLAFVECPNCHFNTGDKDTEADAILSWNTMRVDDPQWDSTDFAHPAFFRGQEDGVRGACRVLRDVLEKGLHGVTAQEDLQRLREDLEELRKWKEFAEEANNLLDHLPI